MSSPNVVHAKIIAGELKLDPGQVERTLGLFAEGATMPFVARYRKEVTGNLDEVQLGTIQERAAYLAELDARKHREDAVEDRAGRSLPAVQAEAAHARDHRQGARARAAGAEDPRSEGE